MRLAWQRYSGTRGFTPDEFRALVSEVAGQRSLGMAPPGAHIHRGARLLAGPMARPSYPHRYVPRPARVARPDDVWPVADAQERRRATRRLMVRRGTPAYEAGVNVDDEILALGEYRVRPDGWEARLEAYRPGDRVDAPRRQARAHHAN